MPWGLLLDRSSLTFPRRKEALLALDHKLAKISRPALIISHWSETIIKSDLNTKLHSSSYAKATEGQSKIWNLTKGNERTYMQMDVSILDRGRKWRIEYWQNSVTHPDIRQKSVFCLFTFFLISFFHSWSIKMSLISFK